ncbi:PREDICTED: delta-like protein D, partial [Acropora digitifera]|uniref:delta-like protein D n=1 Tax=Acropora digitifera TaxID=70779 RepID=UPI00077A3D12
MHCRDFTRQLVAAIVKGIQCLCLRYLLVVLLAASLPRCQGRGMFQVQFLDYANPNQTDAQNRCCNRDADSQGNCRSPCRTFFTVCLQPQSSNRCIYGQASSGILGSESFVIPSNSLLQGQVTSWPVSFEMVISAKHRQDANSSAVLIEKATITKNYLLPNGQWSNFTHVGPVARIRFSYRFVCQQHYYGSSCSTLCVPRNDTFGHYTCDGQGRIVCLPGWTATRSYCSTGRTFTISFNLVSCSRIKPCKNGALCRNKPGSFDCICPKGYTGRLCEIEIDECSSNPCFHGGNCTNTFVFISDLVSCSRIKPCKNGALCRNKPGSFDCICPKGYTGRLCEIEIDECSSNPCFHGGNCTDLIGDYNCTCPKGYGGKQCFSICSPNTCQNGGRCVNGIRGSFCTCKEGFTGASCEQVLPTRPPNNSNTGESSSHSSNHPSSHSSNHPSSHSSNHPSSHSSNHPSSHSSNHPSSHSSNHPSSHSSNHPSSHSSNHPSSHSSNHPSSHSSNHPSSHSSNHPSSHSSNHPSSHSSNHPSSHSSNHPSSHSSNHPSSHSSNHPSSHSSNHPSSHSSNHPSSHSSNHPSSHSSNHPSNHLSSTRESTTNASTAEPTTAFPSKNGTGGTFKERESG